jgi:hypothetical protein
VCDGIVLLSLPKVPPERGLELNLAALAGLDQQGNALRGKERQVVRADPRKVTAIPEKGRVCLFWRNLLRAAKKYGASAKLLARRARMRARYMLARQERRWR